MEIKALVKKLFEQFPTSQINLVDNWTVYELPRGYTTTFKLETLFKEFAIFGINNQGDQLIMAKGYNVLICYPAREDRHGKIRLALREDNLRPVFLNDVSEEEDFHNNRQAPKLRYGYIWREQVSAEDKATIAVWQQELQRLETLESLDEYEADNKSWHFIESTMLNKQDLVPQIRNSFKPYTKVETEHGLLYTFPAGFIAIDRDRFFTIALDQEVATGALTDLHMAQQGDGESIANLIDRLRHSITPIEDGYMAFTDGTLETAMLSAIGNSI